MINQNVQKKYSVHPDLLNDATVSNKQDFLKWCIPLLSNNTKLCSFKATKMSHLNNSCNLHTLKPLHPLQSQVETTLADTVLHQVMKNLAI